ncbi:pyridoxal phosphate-dependent aminotransferase [Dactylosporangium sp. AC04546]|uniref:pyridoxal phosphate-dependent aminotransferase n=1 Tax=Dactylosporangium sp. AC04546 TaxID=2862460 RepID=UPI001EE139BB|nr:pyridoxal phosphate-dependent aminotransferase [Dactylosporangium sp. AC04546]WVK86754.1 pyridoxal phosphate-dependent aminotransferase [Dactylosporangium sp. AC04546]
MTALAQRISAVNLGQGFPDTDGPSRMLAVARNAVDEGLNQYPPMNGLPQLRRAVTAQRLERYATAYDPDSEVLVTVGATEAIAASLIALCEPGDEVLYFEPAYDSYLPGVAMAGGVPVPIRLRPDGGGFAFDLDELTHAVSGRTRLLLLNSPHNPTGKVFTREELEAIARVCREHDIIVISDEVYEYLTYDGATHTTIATLPGMRNRTLAVSSAGKTFSVTGWKVGWVCGPADLVAAVRTAKQFLTFAASAPFQAAVAVGLREELGWVETWRTELRDRRDQLRGGLEQIGAAVLPCQGTYFLQIDTRSLGYADGQRFCQELAQRCGVVAIPSRAFFEDVEAGLPYVRFAFCKRSDVVAEATRRLSSFNAKEL